MATIATCIAAAGTTVGFLYFNQIGWAFQEGRPITILSLILLLAIGYVCEQTWKIRSANNNPPNIADKSTVWWFLSWGFYIAAWDEFLKLHETLDRKLHYLVGRKPTNFTDHLDDIFVAMYGVIGLWILWVYRKEIFLYSRSIYYFSAAAVAGMVSVVIDTLGSDKMFLSKFFFDKHSLSKAIDILDIVEESFKIGAEIFFVALAIRVYKIAIELTKGQGNLNECN